ncbi:MAG: CCDC90 family protein [Magnetococcus sp. YQC-5]
MTSYAATFDTHKFIKQMIATGFTEEQAETQVHLLSEILGYQLSTKADVAKLDVHVIEIKRDIKELDTKIVAINADLKRDIKELDVKIETVKTDLQKDMALMESNLKRDIESSKVDTLKWTAGMFVAQTAMIIGALFAMMKMNQLSVQEMRLQAPTTKEVHQPAPTSTLPVAPPLR